MATTALSTTRGQEDLLLDFVDCCILLRSAWQQQETAERDCRETTEAGQVEAVATQPAFAQAVKTCRRAYNLALEAGVTPTVLDNALLQVAPAAALRFSL